MMLIRQFDVDLSLLFKPLIVVVTATEQHAFLHASADDVNRPARCRCRAVSGHAPSTGFPKSRDFVLSRIIFQQSSDAFVADEPVGPRGSVCANLMLAFAAKLQYSVFLLSLPVVLAITRVLWPKAVWCSRCPWFMQTRTSADVATTAKKRIRVYAI